MNRQQKRALAWAAFQAGVQNGGDSSPVDRDYWEIQEFVATAFESWWCRYTTTLRSPAPHRTGIGNRRRAQSARRAR